MSAHGPRNGYRIQLQICFLIQVFATKERVLAKEAPTWGLTALPVLSIEMPISTFFLTSGHLLLKAAH